MPATFRSGLYSAHAPSHTWRSEDSRFGGRLKQEVVDIHTHPRPPQHVEEEMPPPTPPLSEDTKVRPGLELHEGPHPVVLLDTDADPRVTA